MTDQFQAAPDGAATWKSDRTRHTPKPSEHKIGDPEIGISGAHRVRLDPKSFWLPPDQRTTHKLNGLSHSEEATANGQDGSGLDLPNGGSSHIAEAGFRAATPIGADNFAEIPVFDGLTPVGIPGADGGTE